MERAGLQQVQHLRALFLQEGNLQFISNAYHERKWSDLYSVEMEGFQIGYGGISGSERTNRDTIFEFYLIPACRKFAGKFFSELIQISQAKYIECQTNDKLIHNMLNEFAKDINEQAILFSDHKATEWKVPGVEVRPRKTQDYIFEHKHEPQGDYVLIAGGEIVATGGFLTHYNFPFADLYMEVKEEHRQKGYGSFLIQEIKKYCYLMGRVPAARCNIDNIASKSTLLKAGMQVCGYVVKGEIRK